MSKKSAERKCLSRLVFPVSIDAEAMVTVPVTSPVGDTVALPVTWRKMPFTLARPQIILFCSETVERDWSRLHSLASAGLVSSSCRATAVICSDGAMVSSCGRRTVLTRTGPAGSPRPAAGR